MYPQRDERWIERAKRVRFVLMDVDGVLTDGGVVMLSDGAEGRVFSVRDGHGFVLGRRAGLRFGLISGRRSPVVDVRARELGIEEVHQGVQDKAARFEQIRARVGLPAEAFAYVGDDLVDAPVMARVGLAVAPADAEPEILERAHWVTRSRGGQGVAREVIRGVLEAQGRWRGITAAYLEA